MQYMWHKDTIYGGYTDKCMCACYEIVIKMFVENDGSELK